MPCLDAGWAAAWFRFVSTIWKMLFTNVQNVEKLSPPKLFFLKKGVHLEFRIKFSKIKSSFNTVRDYDIVTNRAIHFYRNDMSMSRPALNVTVVMWLWLYVQWVKFYWLKSLLYTYPDGRGKNKPSVVVEDVWLHLIYDGSLKRRLKIQWFNV